MSIDKPSSAEPILDQFDVGNVIDVIRNDGCTTFRIQTGQLGFHARPATAFITGLRLLGITSDNAEIINNDTKLGCNISLMGILLVVLTKGVTFDLIIQGTLDDVKIQDITNLVHYLNGKY